MFFNLISLLLLLHSLPFLSCSTPGESQNEHTPEISPSLLKLLLEQNSAPPGKTQRVNILLSMRGGKSVKEIFENIQRKFSTSTPTRQERLTTVVTALKTQAHGIQQNLLSFLDDQRMSSNESYSGHKVHQLWVTNQVFVENADIVLVGKLLERNDIDKIGEEIIIPLDEPIDFELSGNRKTVGSNVQWGVANVGAPLVWETLQKNGQGVVIGSIDTGVRVTHEALKNNFRGEHGWLDPVGGSTVPIDEYGHGTHTMGTIVGTANGIGVAPGAQWIACRGCGPNCLNTHILLCGQFMLCPTDPFHENPDCSKAPHIISNSWGGNMESGTEFNEVIAAWKAGGIIPIFSIGNSGPSCRSTVSPGNGPDVIGVGSITQYNDIADFSSAGPVVLNGRTWIKPDVVSPGKKILSSYNGADDQYAVLSGTSMSCPHVVGLAALFLSHNPNMTFDQIKTMLQDGAQPTTLSSSTATPCGEIEGSVYPNNHAGYGRVDAKHSFSLEGIQLHSRGSGGKGIVHPGFVLTLLASWILINKFQYFVQ